MIFYISEFSTIGGCPNCGHTQEIFNALHRCERCDYQINNSTNNQKQKTMKTKSKKSISKLKSKKISNTKSVIGGAAVATKPASIIITEDMSGC